MRFCCPKCKEELCECDGVARCRRGHTYDRARGGYYNLLLSNAGGVHGDNRDMVLARRAFLGAGFYTPLSEAMAALVLEYTEPGAPVLDAGCGEGYYTDAVERALYLRDGVSDVSAFDISKDAVREIGKKNKRISLAVAGSYHIPANDGEFSCVINTFSPLALEETSRVLSDGGVFIMAIPDEMHLFELKSLIYDTPYKNEVKDSALSGFELVRDVELRYTMQLSRREDILSLFMMTPYAYRTSKENRERIQSVENLDCTAHFRVFVYRKNGGAG